ncbi:MAG: hypothetical protein ACT4QC_13370 [Planctomycetaceae bacterium]
MPGWAAAQPPQTAPAPGSAEEELVRARNLLLAHTSVQGRIVEKVDVFDRGYTAEGQYLQTALKPNDWHMKLDLVLKVGDAQGSLLEVCDGEVLWTSIQIDTGKRFAKKANKEQTVTRRNVNQILAAARKAGETTETAMVTSLGLGGLPALLSAFERDMRFTGLKEDVFRGRPVVVIQGVWQDRMVAQFTGQPSTEGSALLPAVVPDSVWVYLDRETGVPLRVLYLKKLPERQVSRPMLTLDFLDVTINEPIDLNEFAYEPPPGVTPMELTNQYVDRLTPPPASEKPAAP